MEENSKKYQDIEDASHQLDQFNKFSTYDRYYDTQIKNLRLSVPWVILTFGLIGNIIILIIFTKKLRRRNSNAFCFCALAISDTFSLIFMLFRAMLKTEILNNLNVTCKVVKFLYHYFLQVSSWCLVLLTLDRLIAVTFVFKYQTWSKKLHVIKLFFAIIVVILLINVHLLIFVNVFEKNGKYPSNGLELDGFPKAYKPKNNTKFSTTKKFQTTTSTIIKKSYTCNVSFEKYPFYYKNIYKHWDIYHSIVYGSLPFIIVFISNCVIIFKLLKRDEKSARFKTNSIKDDPSIKSFQLTVMLLTIAFTFLVLTFPISIYMAYIYDNLTSVRESKREFIKVILRYLGYVNNAINFYIYFLTSNEFRREVANLFRCLLPKSSVSSLYSACTTSSSLPDINIETKPFKKRHDVVLKAMDKRISEFEAERETFSTYEYENFEIGHQTRKQDPEEMKKFLTRNEIDGVVTSV
jgi:hypothetical protein